MKFTIVVVLLALALGANSSVLPLGPVVVGGPWGGSVVVGHGHHPAVIGVPGSVAIQAAAVPTVVGGHVVAGPGPVQVVSGPVPAVVAHAHAPVVSAAHAVVPGASFVAKTRGAVHVAPLAGHVQSVVSANVQPAPGTV